MPVTFLVKYVSLMNMYKLCIDIEERMCIKFLIRVTREGITMMLERILTFIFTYLHNRVEL